MVLSLNEPRMTLTCEALVRFDEDAVGAHRWVQRTLIARNLMASDKYNSLA